MRQTRHKSLTTMRRYIRDHRLLGPRRRCSLRTASASARKHAIAAAEVTVAEQLLWLAERLAELPREPQDTQPWFLLHPSLPAKICLFLALLELSKQGRIRLEQAQTFGPLAASPV